DAADLIAIFDDDFVAAPDFLAQAERLFEADPGLVGANGHLLHDGARGPGISFEDACAIVERDAETGRGQAARPLAALYGCNMLLRASAIGDLRFDENLPLYGWQEDIDFTVRLGKRGRLEK